MVEYSYGKIDDLNYQPIKSLNAINGVGMNCSKRYND